MSPGPTDPTIERVFREVNGQAVATLVRLFGDVALAEDAVQDAFAIASSRWPTEGVPPNPAGWIVTTARNRATDQLRRAKRGRQLEREVTGTEPEPGEEEPMPQDQLRLIFTCCHPSLRIEHRVALTLRLLGGLSVEEIARSFLVSEAAMAKRLVRARYKIKAAKIPYRVPSDNELPARLGAVLAVLYLIYNTGAAQPERESLRADALRLTRSLVSLMPDEPEAAGLLALMVLNESRMPARWKNGDIVLLRHQDRLRWRRRLIDEGHRIVRDSLERNRPGPFQLQAAIQAVHCDAPSFGATDWPQIVRLYDQLYAVQRSPVVALNRAIAIGEVQGAAAALRLLDDLRGPLDGYYLMHATRATLLHSLGDVAEARGAFERAAELATTEPERRYLREEIDRLDSPV
ncbi:MAG: sigma-70 family RNA polymerase sigma factor [Acidimicrobiia bacterium]|nr:sigma-70 family RNA polymerase sigma factor [Acidimicrobiia bacterium]NNF09351.1 sigma-70 family RNA polymerase sigma factor [Acidimicrobiia bacterium]NNL71210.1 sigma-70 family RNA polymerase sigma factor [Acidimicrobiia bacterium]